MAVVSETPRRSADRAFEHLYRKHVAAVYRYSLALLGDPADAEDVTQTTFLNAYRAYTGGQRPRKPESWLITIAHNVCRQRFRQAQARPYEVELEEDAAEALEPDDTVPTPEELRRAFEQLAPRQRAALVMRELEGRNYEEIASVLGLSTTALETLLFRARRALREQLEEQLTCREAAFAISKRMDGELPWSDARALKRHLRSCPPCRELAQTQSRHRQLLRGLLMVPLPSSLHSFFGHGAVDASAAAGGAVTAAKVAGVVAAITVAGGGVYEAGVHVTPSSPPKQKPKPAVVVPAASVRAQPPKRVRLVAPPTRTPVRHAVAAPAPAKTTPAAAATWAPHGSAAAAGGRALGRSKPHAPAAKPHAPAAKAHAAPHTPHAQQAPPHRAQPASNRPARAAASPSATPTAAPHGPSAPENRSGPPTRTTPSERPGRSH